MTSQCSKLDLFDARRRTLKALIVNVLWLIFGSRFGLYLLLNMMSSQFVAQFFVCFDVEYNVDLGVVPFF